MKLNKQHRTVFVGSILREEFEPRWGTLADSLTLIMKGRVKDEHPVFCKSLTDLELRPYLQVSGSMTPQWRANNCFVPFRSPVYTRMDDFDGTRVESSCYVGSGCGIANLAVHVSHPSQVKTETRIGGNADEDLLVELHRKLWKDFICARAALLKLVNSYNVVEKLGADFPEYSRFLPVPPVKTQALVIPVGDLRAQLAGVGISSRKVV